MGTILFVVGSKRCAEQALGRMKEFGYKVNSTELRATKRDSEILFAMIEREIDLERIHGLRFDDVEYHPSADKLSAQAKAEINSRICCAETGRAG